MDTSGLTLFGSLIRDNEQQQQAGGQSAPQAVARRSAVFKNLELSDSDEDCTEDGSVPRIVKRARLTPEVCGRCQQASVSCACKPALVMPRVVFSSLPRLDSFSANTASCATSLVLPSPPAHPPALPRSMSVNSNAVLARGRELVRESASNMPCPRCHSTNTKFCYFNNYNVKQPRHFCRACQRYWTAGGLLRNVPVGAGKRKSKSEAQQKQQTQHDPAPSTPAQEGLSPAPPASGANHDAKRKTSSPRPAPRPLKSLSISGSKAKAGSCPAAKSDASSPPTHGAAESPAVANPATPPLRPSPRVVPPADRVPTPPTTLATAASCPSPTRVGSLSSAFQRPPPDVSPLSARPESLPNAPLGPASPLAPGEQWCAAGGMPPPPAGAILPGGQDPAALALALAQQQAAWTQWCSMLAAMGPPMAVMAQAQVMLQMQMQAAAAGAAVADASKAAAPAMQGLPPLMHGSATRSLPGLPPAPLGVMPQPMHPVQR